MAEILELATFPVDEQLDSSLTNFFITCFSGFAFGRF
jgi:hypothetical protein